MAGAACGLHHHCSLIIIKDECGALALRAFQHYRDSHPPNSLRITSRKAQHQQLLIRRYNYQHYYLHHQRKNNNNINK